MRQRIRYVCTLVKVTVPSSLYADGDHIQLGQSPGWRLAKSQACQRPLRVAQRLDPITIYACTALQPWYCGISEQGSQYASEQFQRLIGDHGITCSMSRSGNVWDNAAMESFFSSLKTERTARKVYRARNDAKADVFDYI